MSNKTSFTLPEDLKWAFKKEANNRRISYSAAVRLAFAAFIAKRDISPDPADLAATDSSEKIEGESISTVPTDSSVDSGALAPGMANHATAVANLPLHEMLDEILGSGIPEYVTEVEVNLEWGSRSTRQKKGQTLEGSGDTDAAPEYRTPEKAQLDAERTVERAKDAVRRSRGTKRRDRKAPKRDAS
jgi:hypothetical protein